MTRHSNVDNTAGKYMVKLKRGAGLRRAWPAFATMLLIAGMYVFPAWGQTAPAEAADAIVGVWADEQGDMEIELFRCESVYCAKIASLAEPLENGQPRTDAKNPDRALRARPLIGLQIISDLAYEAEGTWQGTMYAPLKGKQVKITFTRDSPSTLRAEVSKFIFRKMVIWTRVSK